MNQKANIRRIDHPSTRSPHRNALLVAFYFLASASTSSNGDNKGSIFFGGVPTVVAAQNRFKQGGRGGQQQQGQQQGFGGYNQQQGNDPNEFYGVLNIPMNASQKDIKSAYRKLALKFHVSTTYEVYLAYHVIYLRVVALLTSL